MAAIAVKTAGTRSLNYAHTDHLGSLRVVTDAGKNIKSRYRYDAWGVRTRIAGTDITNRGFTGHEHLDDFGLINMNARMYDPALGRFLSVDPYVQMPDYTQSFNRYSYALNNPLVYTDPSGYSWLSDNWKSLLSSVVAITAAAVVTIATGGTGAGLGYAILSGAAGGFAGGATGAMLNGANFGQIMKAGAVGAFWGGLSAGVSFGVGELAKNGGMQLLGKMYAHGISQGALTAAQGGKFQHGFFSAAFTAGAAPGIMKMTKPGFGRVVASSVIGGTASVLGGGKFANGAVTGAYVMMFNEIRHDEKSSEVESRKPKVDFQKATDQEKIDQLLYAFDYENAKYEETGEYSPIDLDNYFSNLPVNGGVGNEGSHYFEGSVKIDGKSITVGADFVAYKKYRYPFATQYSGAAQQYVDNKWTVLKFYRYPHSGTHGHFQLLLKVSMNGADAFIKRYDLQ